jgi:replicative DNA helicase
MIPIIALSQLNRMVETRKESKMPQLSDLRESGAIEQDADMVMFIYRPEYYEVNNNEMGESTKGETHIRIAKHRNGSLETIKLKASLNIQKFEEWDNLGDFPEGGRFFVQKESKMNSAGDFDEGFGGGDAPF